VFGISFKKNSQFFAITKTPKEISYTKKKEKKREEKKGRKKEVEKKKGNLNAFLPNFFLSPALSTFTCHR